MKALNCMQNGRRAAVSMRQSSLPFLSVTLLSFSGFLGASRRPVSLYKDAVWSTDPWASRATSSPGSPSEYPCAYAYCSAAFAHSLGRARFPQLSSSLRNTVLASAACRGLLPHHPCLSCTEKIPLLFSIPSTSSLKSPHRKEAFN